jgi:hypothetical protein
VIASRQALRIFVLAAPPAAVIIATIIRAALSGVVHTRRWTFGSNSTRVLLLEIATAVETVDAIGYAARSGRVPMSCASLAKGRVARAFVTLEQIAVVMPTLTSLVITLPGALEFSLVRRTHVRTPRFVVSAIESLSSAVACASAANATMTRFAPDAIFASATTTHITAACAHFARVI